MKSKLGLSVITNIFGISHTELANRIGVSKQQVSMWVNGKRSIPDKWLEKISSFNKFKNVPKRFFVQEFSRIDEIDVELMHLLSLIDQSGTNEEINRTWKELEEEQNLLSILKNTSDMLENEYEYYENVLRNLNRVFLLKSKKRAAVLSVILSILTKKLNEIGKTPAKETIMSEDFFTDAKAILDKYSILDDLKLVKDGIGYRIEVSEKLDSLDDL